MNLSLQNYFLLFIIYSFLGWAMEVTCKSIEYKRFINRGFLIGPYCPIYGWGAILITKVLYRYSNDYLVMFIMTILTCGILEYLTSYAMEKLFKARWWDYSKKSFNINGRVCLSTIIPFGILGLFITYITNPFFIGILDKINIKAINITAIILGIIYIIDNIISFIVIFGFRATTQNVNKEGSSDDTEEITKKVRAILSQKSIFYRRLINAYPKLMTIKAKIKQIKNEIKENVEEVKTNINEKKEEVRNNIEEKKEILKEAIQDKKEDLKTVFTEQKQDENQKGT